MDLATASTIHDFLEINARLRPGKIAFIQDEQRMSYGEINSRANRLAAWLVDQGLAAGERVVLLLENSAAYVISYYAIQKSGGVAVPLNSELKAEPLSALLRELQPKVIIAGGHSGHLLQQVDLQGLGVPLTVMTDDASPSPARRAAAIPLEDILRGAPMSDPGLPVHPSSLASIIYTSGSTGKPKGVMLTHQNIVVNTRSIVQYLALTERDVQMVVLPFFYVMGKSLLNTHFAVGGTVVVNNGFAYPASVIRQMVAERVTGFSGVPSTYAYLLHRSPLQAYRDKLESLRYCTQAGGHMSRQIKEKLLETLPPHTKLFVMYGATEAAARLAYVEPDRLRSKIDSIGKAIPGVTIRVLDEKGREVSIGESGELVASGANIMQGYWMDPVATARALDENGYHTGDLGYRDEEGYLYVTGRKDDLLKVGGHRIDPQEIEDAMMATGHLLEVAVVGVDDDLLGKRLVALAVPLTGAPAESGIVASCMGMLPRYKVPTEIRFAPSLPKSANSKIDRAACLALVDGAAGR